MKVNKEKQRNTNLFGKNNLGMNSICRKENASNGSRIAENNK